MSNITEQDQFDANVYQIDLTDPVLGGPTGPSNKAPISLANRTRWLLNALRFGRATFAAESGTANHYVANIASAPATLEEGMEVRFQAVNANTGAADFTPNSTGGAIAALPILGADHNPLQGAEISALGEVTLRYTSKYNTGGGGAWVLVRSTGGIQRAVTPSVGDATNAVATMTALFNAADGMAAVSVAGGADVTLTAAQYGSAMLKLTGTPTANINLVFPAQTGQWVIQNSQGGSFNVTAKTSAGGSVGVVIPAGVAVLVYSDGTNVGFASSQGQSSFRRSPLTGVTGVTQTVSGGYTAGALIVEKNGLWLEPGVDFTATNGSTITLTTAAISTDMFNFYAFGTFNVANAVLKSGDTMAGPLLMAAGSTAPTPAAGDNSTAVATTEFANTLAAHGQCRLSFVSATSLNLSPYNGSLLNINGVARKIPAAGVPLSNAGLPPATFHYVYAFMNVSTMTLEASTTGHSTHTNGVEIKTGDPTRTLVGALYTNGSSQFTDATTARYVINWFHRRVLNLALVGAVGTFTNTGAVTELDATKRLFWINWADEGISINLSGQAVNSAGGNDVVITGGLDNGTVVTNQSGGTVTTASFSIPFSCASVIAASEGAGHILQLLGRVGGGGGNLVGLGMSVATRG